MYIFVILYYYCSIFPAAVVVTVYAISQCADEKKENALFCFF